MGSLSLHGTLTTFIPLALLFGIFLKEAIYILDIRTAKNVVKDTIRRNNITKYSYKKNSKKDR